MKQWVKWWNTKCFLPLYIWIILESSPFLFLWNKCWRKDDWTAHPLGEHDESGTRWKMVAWQSVKLAVFCYGGIEIHQRSDNQPSPSLQTVPNLSDFYLTYMFIVKDPPKKRVQIVSKPQKGVPLKTEIRFTPKQNNVCFQLFLRHYICSGLGLWSSFIHFGLSQTLSMSSQVLWL